MLRQQTGGNLIYSPEQNIFMLWDGSKWLKDEHKTHAQQAALSVAEHYFKEAKEIRQKAESSSYSPEDQKRFAKIADSLDGYGKACRNKRNLDAMLAVFARDLRVSVSASKFDRNLSLLGVQNGVVDLRTGELRAAARDEFVTKRAKHNYIKGAPAPQFEQFVREVTGSPIAAKKDTATGLVLPDSVGQFSERPGLARYLQKALGYSITGETREHKMFIAVGAGGNGKNVLLDIVQGVIGDYWQTIPPEALMATRGDADAERPSPTLASLAGARAAVCGESRDGHKLDVATVKRHTGGGTMKARFMRENSFTFEITHKLFLMTNILPSLDHLDDAMRGRLHVIPFDRQWNRPGHTQRNPALPDGDKNLMDKLKAESEGILAWLVRGAVEYHAQGLEPPVAVTSMTREYFDSADALGQWLEDYEACPISEGSRCSDLFSAFKLWCHCNEFKDDRSMKSFSEALATREYPRGKKSDGRYFGIRLNPEAKAMQQKAESLFD